MGADYGSFDPSYPRGCVLTIADCDICTLRLNKIDRGLLYD